MEADIPKYTMGQGQGKGEDTGLPSTPPGAQYPVDHRPPPRPDAEGVDRLNDSLMTAPAPAQVWPQLSVPDNTMTRQSPAQYNPADTNRDGIVSQVEQYLNHQTMSPDERAQDWTQQNVWAKGYTVDMGTGEIIDPQSGRPVGRLPSFE